MEPSHQKHVESMSQDMTVYFVHSYQSLCSRHITFTNIPPWPFGPYASLTQLHMNGQWMEHLKVTLRPSTAQDPLQTCSCETCERVHIQLSTMHYTII